jgi:hypothetical protein
MYHLKVTDHNPRIFCFIRLRNRSARLMQVNQHVTARITAQTLFHDLRIGSLSRCLSTWHARSRSIACWNPFAPNLDRSDVGSGCRSRRLIVEHVKAEDKIEAGYCREGIKGAQTSTKSVASPHQFFTSAPHSANNKALRTLGSILVINHASHTHLRNSFNCCCRCLCEPLGRMGS